MKKVISIHRIIGLTLLHALLIAAIVLGGYSFAFINIPSLFIVIGGTFFALLATYQHKLLKLTKDALIDSISKEIEPNKEYVEILQSARKYFLTFGVIGAIICLIQNIYGFSDIYRALPAIGVSLVTILYGLFGGNILCVFLETIYSENQGQKQ